MLLAKLNVNKQSKSDLAKDKMMRKSIRLIFATCNDKTISITRHFNDLVASQNIFYYGAIDKIGAVLIYY